MELITADGDPDISGEGRRAMETPRYTALVCQSDGWWFRWVEQISGINGQERAKEELLESLEISPREAVEDDSSIDPLPIGVV